MTEPTANPDALQERKYHLKCQLKFVTKSIQDFDGKKPVNRERTMALLIPDMNDEAVRFMTAWLPDVAGEHFELASYIGGPVHSPCRVAIIRGPTKDSMQHHLMVMSYGVEEVMRNHMKEGTILAVTILPQSDEGETDFARDTDQSNFQTS